MDTNHEAVEAAPTPVPSRPPPPARSECVTIREDAGPVMLMDLSYYIFYRYYALLAWYRKSDTALDDDEGFLRRFERLFVSSLMKLCKGLGIPPGRMYMVGDCPRWRIWRMDLLTTYKSNRENRQKVKPGVFELVYTKILPGLREKHGTQFLCVDGAEADDVIGWIHRHSPNVDKTIITNDHDYLQLKDDRTRILNMHMVDICRKGTGCPRKDLQMKILTGDVSDNIAAVMSKKRASVYVAMPFEEMIKQLREDGYMDRYRENERLVDMRLIPENIHEAIRVRVSIV